MDDQKRHIRHCILYAFHRKLTGAAAAREICAVYGEGSTTSRTCERWFTKFRSGDTNLEDEPREGHPSTIDDDVLESLLESNPRQTTRELAEALGCTHTTIEEHLKALGKVVKFRCWIPHELTVDNKKVRLTTFASLLFRFNNDNFLNRIGTGDEKWLLYINRHRKHQWLGSGEHGLPEAKADLHPRKIMLCVWWD